MSREIPPREDSRDLGFGSVVSADSSLRLLNKDGTFNVEREGLAWHERLSPYSWLLTLSWPKYLLTAGVFLLVANALFALGYLALGPHALAGAEEIAAMSPFWRAFFFSVESLSTVGYGHIVPRSFAAHLLMTIESILGLLCVALVTGMAFARFSRPVPRIAFSKTAVVSPFRDGQALMFRLAHRRTSQMLQVQARVIFSRFEHTGGKRMRRYYPLALDRDQVNFLPLAWTIVHPIDAESPLAGRSREQLKDEGAEILVLLTAVDEVHAQLIHSRTSYMVDEIHWNARFADLFRHPERTNERLSADIGRLDDVILLESGLV